MLVELELRAMAVGLIALPLYFLLWAKIRLLVMEPDHSHNQIKSFYEIRKIIQDNRLWELGRSSDQEALYQQTKEEREKVWESISDYILHDKFHFDYILNEKGKRMIPRPLPNWSKGLIRTVPNDFPYNFQSDVKHLILWKLGDEIYENDIIRAINQLKIDDKTIDDFCYFINPNHLKSILDIDHAHIILHTISPIPSTLTIWSKRIQKGVLYGAGGLSLLILGKVLHTGYLLHTFQQDLLDLRTSFTIIKFFQYYTKYFIPFPFSLLANYLIKRLTPLLGA